MVALRRYQRDFASVAERLGSDFLEKYELTVQLAGEILAAEASSLTNRQREIAEDQLFSLRPNWGWGFYFRQAFFPEDRLNDRWLRWIISDVLRLGHSERRVGEVPEWSRPEPTPRGGSGLQAQLCENVVLLRSRLEAAFTLAAEWRVHEDERWIVEYFLRAGDRHLAYLAKALASS